jgi:hypothetical protein
LSDDVQQPEDQQDQQNGAETSAGTITPTATVGPRGEGADEQQNDDDEENYHILGIALKHPLTGISAKLNYGRG